MKTFSEIEILSPSSYSALSDLWYSAKNLTGSDAPALIDFKEQLSSDSREAFCPYPWNDPVALPKAVNSALMNSESGQDLVLGIFHSSQMCGHCFLWKFGGNPESERYGLQVPELGIAIAEKFQGKGLGKMAMNLLEEACVSTGRDGIELTTAMDNSAGFHLYQKCGYEYIGDISIPLEVDVTDTAAARSAGRWRTERHMVKILNESRRGEIMSYLKAKRES